MMLSILVVGVSVGAFYALISAAFQLVYGSSRVLNFAQGEFVVLGMFGMWMLNVGTGLSPWIALAALVPIGFMFGVAFCYVVAMPLFGRHFFQLALGTLSAAFIIRGVLSYVAGGNIRIIPPFLSGSPFALGSVFVTRQQTIILGAAFMALASLYLFFRYTWVGLAMRATAENQEGVEVVGVQPRRVMLLAFGLSGAVSSLAGAVMSPILGARFDLGLDIMLVAFVAAVLGGLSSTAAATAGGFAFGLSIAAIAATIGSQWQTVWVLAVLLPLLYLRPEGLLGRFVRT